jgi:hypothetical protein
MPLKFSTYMVETDEVDRRAIKRGGSGDAAAVDGLEQAARLER